VDEEDEEEDEAEANALSAYHERYGNSYVQGSPCSAHKSCAMPLKVRRSTYMRLPFDLK
jgi:hypothetical protein